MMLRIHFRPKVQGGGRPYLYCRLRLNGEVATDFSTGVDASDGWNQQAQRFKGRGVKYEQYNALLVCIENDVRELLLMLSRAGNVTARTLRNTYIARNRTALADLVADYLSDLQKKVQQGTTELGTYKAHRSKCQNVMDFSEKYGLRNLEDFDENSAIKFADFLASEKGHSQNHKARNVGHLVMLFEWAVQKKRLEKVPFTNTEKHDNRKPILFLNLAEISAIETHYDLYSDSEKRVADLFLIQCFTGLSYSDLRGLSRMNVVAVQGREFLQINRAKNGAKCTIPLLKKAAELLEKYDYKLPVIANQKMNGVLRQIGNIAGIKKHLTTHVGRKTAATFFLNEGVPIHTVSKILGHSSVLITEKIYAHLNIETIIHHTSHLT